MFFPASPPAGAARGPCTRPAKTVGPEAQNPRRSQAPGACFQTTQMQVYLPSDL